MTFPRFSDTLKRAKIHELLIFYKIVFFFFKENKKLSFQKESIIFLENSIVFSDKY